MKEFMNAVIYGGIAILAAVFLGLFIDGLIQNLETTEGTLLDLAQSYFLPAYFMIVIIGLLLVLVNVADGMGN